MLIRRTYLPTAADTRPCTNCHQLCQPYPDQDSRLCSWCFYETCVRPQKDMLDSRLEKE